MANVYWIEQVDGMVQQFLNKWFNYLCVVSPGATSPKLPYHCTVAYHNGKDVLFGQIWDQDVGQQQLQLLTRHAIMGPEGVVLAVETNAFLERWYEVPNACPHITVMVGDGFESKHVGPMVRRALSV